MTTMGICAWTCWMSHAIHKENYGGRGSRQMWGHQVQALLRVGPPSLPKATEPCPRSIWTGMNKNHWSTWNVKQTSCVGNSFIENDAHSNLKDPMAVHICTFLCFNEAGHFRRNMLNLEFCIYSLIQRKNTVKSCQFCPSHIETHSHTIPCPHVIWESILTISTTISNF